MIWLLIVLAILAIAITLKFTVFKKKVVQEQNVLENASSSSVNVSITPAQIALIQQTWSQLSANKDQVGELFYNNLFTLAPAVKEMFKGDITVQTNKFISTLSHIVFLIDKADKFIPLLQEMGRRHAQYHVETAHYDIAGQALLLTLEQGLGESYTELVKQAWATAYGLIAQIMINAADQAIVEEAK